MYKQNKDSIFLIFVIFLWLKANITDTNSDFSIIKCPPNI